MDYAPLHWTDAEFEKWREVPDPPADAVAERIIASPHHYQVYMAMAKINKNDDPVDIHIFDDGTETNETGEEHAELLKYLQAYFNDKSDYVFTEEQKQNIKAGCDFFNLHFAGCILSLGVRSLLKQYAAYRATNVLMATNLLVKYPHRRIIETMQFVMDVMDPKWYEDGHYGIRSIQKLRLVHAMIRARIKRKQQDPAASDPNITMIWNDEWGHPINQQDMLFALNTFSVEVIDGLEAFGEVLLQKDIDSYMLTWHYIGKALGVADELNPVSYNDAKAIQLRIYKREFIKQNPNGPALSQPLIEFMERLLSQPKAHVYSIVKLHNDPKDYPLLEQNLQIPLAEAHKDFMRLLKWADRLWHFIIFLRYLLAPKVKRDIYYNTIAMKDHDMVQALLNVEEHYTSKHFSPDAFNDAAARKEEERVNGSSRTFFFKRILVRSADKMKSNEKAS